MAPLRATPLRSAFLTLVSRHSGSTQLTHRIPSFRCISTVTTTTTTIATPSTRSPRPLPSRARTIPPTPAHHPTAQRRCISQSSTKTPPSTTLAPPPFAADSTPITAHTSSETATSLTVPIPASTLSTLPLLHLQSQCAAGQAGLYATIHIHARPYLVTVGDTVRLPFLMPRVAVGDELRLTRASSLGTRDYTLRGAPWVDERVFVLRCVVAAVESEPMRVMHKTKRRNRKIKSVRSKHRYTELVVRELRVRSGREIVQEDVVEVHGEGMGDGLREG